MRLVGRQFTPLLFIAALASAGCGSSYSAICEVYVDCLGGNDEGDLEACEARAEAAEEHAAVEECDEEFEELATCLEEELDCNDHQLDADGCENEYEDLLDCDEDLYLPI